MADHGHHDPGGHELEAINTKLLFRLLISLSLVTLLAAAAVVQWFYSQRRELEGRYAAESSFQLIDYKAKMSTDLEGIDGVAQNLVANPRLLQVPPELVGLNAAAPAEPVLAEPTPEPAPEPAPEPTPDEAPPANEGDSLDAPEGDEPADQPVEVRPADKPAQDQPADDQPADNG